MKKSLKKNDWQNMFDTHIIQRGLNYFSKGMVRDIEKTEDGYAAAVYGTEQYEVLIFLEEDEITDMTCTCPYAEAGNNCKHMAAVLFSLSEDGCNSAVRPYKESGNVKQNQEKDADNVKDLVCSAERTKLEEFLLCELDEDERMLNRFRVFMTDIITESDLNAYKAQLIELFDVCKDRNGFITYYMADEFERGVHEFIDRIICDIMIKYGKQEEAFVLIALMMKEFNALEIDDSNGVTVGVLSRCGTLLTGIAEQSSDALKKRIFDWANKIVKDKDTGPAYDYIEKIWRESFHEPEYGDKRKAVIMSKLDKYEAAGEDYLSEYMLEHWLTAYFQLSDERCISDDEIAAVAKKYWKISAVRQYVVERLTKGGKFSEAVDVLKKSRRLDSKKAGLVMNYTKQMAELYGLLGDVDNQRKELILVITKYNRCDLESFRKLRTCYTEEEWLAVRDMLLDKLENHYWVAELYKEEELYDRLLNSLQNRKSIWMLEQYEKDLKTVYPQELLKIYEDVVRESAKYPGTRNQYREIVRLLRKMKHYPDGKALVAEMIAEFREKYKRRSAMMDELAKL